MKRPELIARVSSFESLNAVLDSADAVYFGVKDLNMRITAKNFSLSEMKRVVSACHKHDVKAYLTVNTIIFDDETGLVEKILTAAKKAGVDAVIAWDFAVIDICRKMKIPVHLSTQASVSNIKAALFYKSLGIRKMVLARELSLNQIKKIIDEAKIEAECFVHGAMCVSVSGRCFMSQFLYNRSANRGDCLQPCRRSYEIKDSEEDKQLRLGNNYVMSPRDLCTIKVIDKLIEAGISSFKIEGRARSPEYAKVVGECYRTAIHAYFDGKLNKSLKDRLYSKLQTVYNRGFSTGFFMGKPIDEWSRAYGSLATEKKVYAGKVVNYYSKKKAAVVKLESLGLSVGDELMVQGPTTGVVRLNVSSIHIEGKDVKKGKKGELVGLSLPLVRKNDKVYVVVKS